jgi:hypothetical protein
MSYLFIMIALLMGVYIAPALAIAPQLLRYPQTATLVPLVSIFFVTLGVDVLSYGNQFNSTTVLGLTVVLYVLALYRVARYCQNATWVFWKQGHLRALFINFCIILPYIIKIGTKAFDTDDEIYSWHYWALQWFYHLPISFEHTGAAYPQAFSKLIAYCYQLLNDVEYQLPVKATLIVLPFCMLNAIAFCSKNLEPKRLWGYFIVCIWAVFVLDWQQYFDYAYAEPLMNASLIGSVSLLWFAQMQSDFVAKQYSLLLAVCLAMLACWSKQAALIWGLFSLPFLLFLVRKPDEPLRPYLLLALLSCLGGVWWIMGEGSHFTQNGGVIGASMASRTWWQQLGYASHRYLIALPQFTLLLLWGLYASRQHRLLSGLACCFILPSLIMWFLFGAYHLRLGLQIITVLSVIIVASDYPVLIKWLSQYRPKQVWHWRQAVIFLLIVHLSGAIWVYQKSIIYRRDLPTYPGGRVALAKFFGSESDEVFNTIYDNPDITVLLSANYIRGLFYTHTETVWPRYKNNPATYTEEDLLADLHYYKPDYVMTSGNLLQGEPMNHLIENLYQKDPKMLSLYTKGSNLHGYRIYRVNLNDSTFVE